MQNLMVDPSVLQFREKGYAIFRHVLSPVLVETLHGVLASEVGKTLAHLSHVGVEPDISTAAKDIDTLLSGPDADKLDKNTRVLMTGHFPPELRMSKKFWEIPRTQALKDILRAVLRSDRLRMHMPPMARYILPNNLQAGVPTHQDASYNDHMNDFVTVWMPLVEINEQCGGVTIFEGRKDGVISVTKMAQNGVWIEGVPIDGLVPVNCVPMAPGDILIFNPYVVHGSMPNLSDKIRFSVDCRFFGNELKSSKHYLDMTTWSVVAPQMVEQ